MAKENSQNIHQNQQIQGSDIFYKTILDFITDPLIVLHPEGMVVYFSNSAMEIFNIKPSGQSIFESAHASMGELINKNFREDIKQLLSDQKPISRICQYQKVDGDIFYGRLNLSPILNDCNNIEYIVLTIPECKCNESENNHYEPDDILHLLAHELRQPVNAIKGFSELISLSFAKPRPDSDKIKKYNLIITQQISYIQKLLDQIFNLANTQVLDATRSSFNINLVLEELYDVFQLRAMQLNKSHINLSVTKLPDSLNTLFFTDSVKLKQIFINILYNALKHTHAGSIGFGYHSKDQNSITFFVSDTGEGIPYEKQNLVFGKYARLDSSFSPEESIGIGLSLSKKIVDLLGGEIWLESQVGEGTTFYFSVAVNNN